MNLRQVPIGSPISLAGKPRFLFLPFLRIPVLSASEPLQRNGDRERAGVDVPARPVGRLWSPHEARGASRSINGIRRGDVGASLRKDEAPAVGRVVSSGEFVSRSCSYCEVKG